MITVKGKVKNGKILALEPVDEFEGKEVEITLVEELKEQENGNGSENNLGGLLKFIQENSIDTGITDMARQHDHYLYGTPKRED